MFQRKSKVLPFIHYRLLVPKQYYFSIEQTYLSLQLKRNSNTKFQAQTRWQQENKSDEEVIQFQ